MPNIFDIQFAFIPNVLGQIIVIWFLLITASILLLAIRVFILNIRNKKRSEIRDETLELVDHYLESGSYEEIPGQLMEEKYQSGLPFLLIDLMEKFRGEDHDRLRQLAIDLGLGEWIKKELNSNKLKDIQRGLMLEKHLLIPEVLPEVKRLLKIKHSMTRVLAYEIYILVGGKDVLSDEIFRSLDAENVEIRRQIVESMTKLGTDAVRPITNYLKTIKYPAVQTTLIEALGILQDPSSIPTLIKILRKTEDHPVQWAALSFFTLTPSKEIIPFALNFSRNDNWEFRRLALVVLAAAAADELFHTCQRLINDPVWDVRFFAAHQMLDFGRRGEGLISAIARDKDDSSSLLMQRAIKEHQMGLKPKARIIGKWLPHLKIS